MPSMRVIEGGLAGSDLDGRPSAIRAAFEHFRLDRQANLAAASTLKHYDDMIEPFLGWLGQTYPHVRRFEQLDVDLVREYRVAEAHRVSKYGRPLSPATLHDTHRLLRTGLPGLDGATRCGTGEFGRHVRNRPGSRDARRRGDLGGRFRLLELRPKAARAHHSAVRQSVVSR